MPASGPTIGRAYVTIIPTTRDAQKNISKALIPELDSAGQQGGDALSGGISSALQAASSKLAKVAKLALVGAGVAAVKQFAKEVVSAYSDYEQMVGGTQTIFKDAAGQVIQNAKNAFAETQMSANTYMETITSFSASLIHSLGGDTAKASDVASVAMKDMADNSLKMGTSIDSIRTAYQGFSRGQYNMLDNLKLGFGGTATEMARLVNESGVLGDNLIDLNDTQNVGNRLQEVGFAKMIEAIHVTQQNLEITGTAGKEAADTLEGSFNRTKAAWDNFMVAIGTGSADEISLTMSQLSESAGMYLKNLLPRIAQIATGLVTGFADALRNAWPILSAFLQNAFANIGQIIQGSPIGEAIDKLMSSKIVTSVSNALGRVQAAFENVFGSVSIEGTLNALSSAFSQLATTAGQAFEWLGNIIAGVFDSISLDAVQGAFEWIKGVLDEIGGQFAIVGAAIQEAIAGIDWSQVNATISAVGEWLVRIGESALPIISDFVESVLMPIISGLASIITNVIIPQLQEYGPAILEGLSTIGWIIESIVETVAALISAIADVLGPLIQGIFAILEPILFFIIDKIAIIAGDIIDSIREIWVVYLKPFIDDIAQFFRNLANWINSHSEQINLIISMIRKALSTLIQWVSDTISGLVSGIGHILGGIVDIVRALWDIISGVFTMNTESIKRGLDTLVHGIVSLFWGLAEIITAPFRSAFGEIKRLWNSTVGGAGFTVPDWIPGVGGKSFRIPYLAQGGTIASSGAVLVGEKGPELLDLPIGARVRPLASEDAVSSESTSYNVMVGDVNLSDDDEVRRITRAYLEQLARLASPGGLVMA